MQAQNQTWPTHLSAIPLQAGIHNQAVHSQTEIRHQTFIPAQAGVQVTPTKSIRYGLNCLVILCLLLTACSSDQAYSPLPGSSVVLAFGNSVTYGTGAGNGEDYPSRLAELTGWQVINAGISGDTAREARQRLGELLRRHDPALVIIELGGNDFLRKRPEQQVGQDLEVMVSESQDHGAVTALVAVPRLSLLRAQVGALNDSPIYRQVADKTGALLIENVFSEVLSIEALQADPIHPNAEGYRLLAQGIADSLARAGLLRKD